MQMGRVLTLTQAMALGCWLPVTSWAQVNSGSNGSDGAFNPTTNIVINMADHPTGIYQYTSVSIPADVTVTFTPNANNTPVVWLVQNNVTMSGTVNLSGQTSPAASGGPPTGGLGGPGGGSGGNGGPTPSSGQGYGAGTANLSKDGANASFATLGTTNAYRIPPGLTYGNVYLLPLVGGSGGGGSAPFGGGGGGGAILIAASGAISLNGQVLSWGGWGGGGPCSGAGSGGAVRLIASRVYGSGLVYTLGGGYLPGGGGGNGFVRFDSYNNQFTGAVSGQFTFGSQFIIIPTSGQLPQLTVTSVGGVPVSASPTGLLSTPDAVLSAQQNNPIPIVVSCANLPLNTLITVSITPANGLPVSAVGYNSTGTQHTHSDSICAAGVFIYATAATGNLFDGGEKERTNESSFDTYASGALWVSVPWLAGRR